MSESREMPIFAKTLPELINEFFGKSIIQESMVMDFETTLKALEVKGFMRYKPYAYEVDAWSHDFPSFINAIRHELFPVYSPRDEVVLRNAMIRSAGYLVSDKLALLRGDRWGLSSEPLTEEERIVQFNTIIALDSFANQLMVEVTPSGHKEQS